LVQVPAKSSYKSLHGQKLIENLAMNRIVIGDEERRQSALDAALHLAD